MRFNQWEAWACGLLMAACAPASAMFDSIAKKFDHAPADTPERAALRAAAPDSWTVVAVDDQGNKYLTNPSRFKTHYSRGVFVVWIRTIAKRPISVYEDRPKPTYLTAMDRFEFNCEAEQLRTMNSVLYDGKGAPVKTVDVEGTWSVVTPNTSGESFLRASCALAVQHGFL